MKIKKKIRILFLILFCIASIKSIGQRINIKGEIKKYYNQPVYLYKCKLDSVIFVDSIITNSQGRFNYIKDSINNFVYDIGMYKIALKNNLYINFINDFKPIVFSDTYTFDFFNNNPIDSLTYLVSNENKEFLIFQNIQNLINNSNSYLLALLRVFPISDPYHKKIEQEYYSRHKMSLNLIKASTNKYCNLIAKAYYQPIIPDWKATDIAINDTIINHFFDYFNPSENFYFNSNILPEKIDEWFSLHKPIEEKKEIDETLLLKAAIEFIHKTKNNPLIFNFSLNYILKKLEKDHAYKAFLNTFDAFLRKDNEDCEQTTKDFLWARNLAAAIRKVDIGNTAPNFIINKDLKLYEIQTNYTLLIFWASWCSHCNKMLPEIKNKVNEFKQKKPEISLSIITVSLDKDEILWKNFVRNNGLNSWLNISDLNGWQGDIPKQYNIYATPTIFLLDKDKKIIDKPLSAEELFKNIE